MADTSEPGDDRALIAGQYAVDTARPLAGAGAGQAAFAAAGRRDHRNDLMGVQVRPGLPARGNVLTLLNGLVSDGLLVPLGHGAARMPDGAFSNFVICPQPPGPSLATVGAPMPESELIETVLRPIAATLDTLQSRGVTHRAIRPDNIFRRTPGTAAVLGCAWAAPPASGQSAIFEPPYVGACLPAGRGEGRIADDVYALGVVLIALATGAVPLAGLDDAAVVKRKLEAGSFAALVGEARLPPLIADLVRGMLAEDPEHRPPPLLLADPETARARRVAARPPRRAQRPLEFAGENIWSARSLAATLAREPDLGAELLRSGSIDRWLRRGLGDPVMGSRIDEAIRARNNEAGGDEKRADTLMIMRAVAIFDPLAPLVWRGMALLPDGLGAAIAQAVASENAPVLAALDQILQSEAIGLWAATRADRVDTAMMVQSAREHRGMLRQKGAGAGIARLAYTLSPLLPCASPLLTRHCVTKIGELLPALEQVAGTVDRKRTPLLDKHVCAFVAARFDQRVDGELALLGDKSPPDQVARGTVRLFARLQMRLHPQPLPGIAGWLAEAGMLDTSFLHSRSRRRRTEEQMVALVKAGQLAPLVTLIEDNSLRDSDQAALGQAEARVAQIEAQLRGLEEGDGARLETARRIGREVAAGLGITASAIVAAILAFS